MEIKSDTTTEPNRLINRKVKRNLLVLFMFASVMLFAGLTSAVVISSASEFWVYATLPVAFYVSTVLIILASIALIFAQYFVKRGNTKSVKLGLVIAFVLGIGFCVSQYNAWQQLVGGGNYFVEKITDAKGNFLIKGEYNKDFYIEYMGEKIIYDEGKLYTSKGKELNAAQYLKLNSHNRSATFVYLLSTLHIIHLLLGILFLIIVLIRSLKNRYSTSSYNGIKLTGIYWHFLGGLWIYLLLFLNFFF